MYYYLLIIAWSVNNYLNEIIDKPNKMRMRMRMGEMDTSDIVQ